MDFVKVKFQSGVLHLDLIWSESHDPDPRDNGSRSLDPHEGIKALPSAMMSDVTKLLPEWGSSVNGTDLGSPDPVARVMLSVVKSCISKPLRFFGSSEDRPEPGSPDPVDGGHGYWFGRGEPSASATEIFWTASVQNMQAVGVSRKTTAVMKKIVLVGLTRLYVMIPYVLMLYNLLSLK